MMGDVVKKTDFRLVEGARYKYIGKIPEKCTGHFYRIKRFVIDVPSYQQKVLVVALTGPDKGLWFTCSNANFASRYEPAFEEPANDSPGQADAVDPARGQAVAGAQPGA